MRERKIEANCQRYLLLGCPNNLKNWQFIVLSLEIHIRHYSDFMAFISEIKAVMATGVSQ